MSTPPEPKREPGKPAAQPAKQQGSPGGRQRVLTMSLFALLIALLTIAGMLLTFWGFGYTPATPAQVASNQQALSELQTSVAGVDSRARSNEVLVTRLDEHMAEVEELGVQLEEGIDQVATARADLIANQATVAAISTTQVEHTNRIDEMERRVDRIARFFQRLGDIADDTVDDLEPGAPTPTPVQEPAPAPQPEATPAPLPTATPVPEAEGEADPAPEEAPDAAPEGEAVPNEAATAATAEADTVERATAAPAAEPTAEAEPDAAPTTDD